MIFSGLVRLPQHRVGRPAEQSFAKSPNKARGRGLRIPNHVQNQEARGTQPRGIRPANCTSSGHHHPNPFTGRADVPRPPHPSRRDIRRLVSANPSLGAQRRGFSLPLWPSHPWGVKLKVFPNRISHAWKERFK